MKRLLVILVVIVAIVSVILLLIDAQDDQGILNKVEKQTTSEKANKVDETEKEPSEEIVIEEVEEKVKQEENEEVEEKAKFSIMIDPGHQAKGNYDLEPVGPNSTEQKPKVASGTQGVVTNKPEYELTLEVSQLLQEVLEEKGFEVQLTRTKNEVDVSNIERAQMANEMEADLFLRIHADGAESATAEGFSVLTPGQGNPDTEKVYEASLTAAEFIVDEVKEIATIHQNGVIFRDDLSGFNWSEVPVNLIELGFMTNPEEDKKLSDDTYITNLTNAIADGVEVYLVENK